MAINPPPHSHLGPINCCPCHLLGRLYCQYLQLHNGRCLGSLYRIKATRPALRYGLMENNWLASVDWMSGVAASSLPLANLWMFRKASLFDRDYRPCAAFTATFMHLLERPLCAVIFFFSLLTSHFMAAKMQWDPFLSSEMPQIESHLPPLQQPASLSGLIEM